MISGLGAPICLDQAQNAVDCMDPECTYGDCGVASPYVPSGGCLDQAQNQVLCTDPECTYGDCLPSSPAPKSGNKIAVSQFPTTIQLTPGPSPRVGVPLSSSIPGSFGLWFGNSSLISGVPNWAVAGMVLVGAMVLGGGGGRRRR